MGKQSLWKYPEQMMSEFYSFGIGEKVQVIYPKDSKDYFDDNTPVGYVIRADKDLPDSAQEPILVILMEDGRVFLGNEVRYQSVRNTAYLKAAPLLGEYLERNFRNVCRGNLPDTTKESSNC